MEKKLNIQNVEKMVITCVAKSLVKNESEINLKSRLMNDLGADSLDFMDIIFQLESAFTIKLKKDDFDFIVSSGLTKEEAVVDGKLTSLAIERLHNWLPDLPYEKDLMPKDLANFLTIESLCLVVLKYKPNI